MQLYKMCRVRLAIQKDPHLKNNFKKTRQKKHTFYNETEGVGAPSEQLQI